MKKFLLLFAFLALTVTVHAQFKVGVKAGLNVSTIGEYGEYDTNYKPGFHAGVMTQFMFTKGLGLESGLYYSMLGGQETERDFDENYEASANPSYLQLPVMLLYKFNITENLHLYPTAGVYAGYGIGGKWKVDGTMYGDDITQDRDFFDDNTNRFDMGATFGLNLQYRKFVLGLGYDQGFLKLNKNQAFDEDDNAFNGTLKVSLGIFL